MEDRVKFYSILTDSNANSKIFEYNKYFSLQTSNKLEIGWKFCVDGKVSNFVGENLKI